ncbi:transcriptional regulator, DeoR family [Beutenbergia cavernae DSM 12333]|uniref:Transcriptional regulator, DeoR family n=1 Tax=Beutenbergia cavernae (strain ATCC BAA-8 / DSM 12333 / CCUG 43141 / JCM 11478 / NBRC 16432 / NCIMB 13614 / HKI 0122) TaxID=471853 RepID=C5BZ88_BEUC1|nr:DeoR/GlpR family DNA-binding transcription regulator [Beutenbergia cavernae]ACQ81203.1 transcriptional regulator, DeoR family [Beutenbergia cavernae DSM 12333]
MTDTPLLADQRRARILAEVARTGGVRVADLVEALGVSEMTVRRDITALDRDGLLTRVHGGAVDREGSASEPAFAEKLARSAPAKAAIAARAAALVEPGAAVAISGGTTTMALASAVAGLEHAASLTILTNSLPAADVLHAAPRRPTVILTGGERTPSDALVGPAAVRTCADFHVDVLFLGVSGMDGRAGLTTPNLAEAETLAALIGCAQRVVVLADSAKWGVVGLRTLARWDAVDILVTDPDLPPDAREALGETTEILEATP